jgi:hypothetical protein
MSGRKAPLEYQWVNIRDDLFSLVKDVIAQKQKEQNKALLSPEYKSATAFIAEATRLRILDITKTTPTTGEE